jgi:hypothetical protein
MVFGMVFFTMGLYSLIIGKIRTAYDTVHNGKIISVFSVRIMDLLIMVLGTFVFLI